MFEINVGPSVDGRLFLIWKILHTSALMADKINFRRSRPTHYKGARTHTYTQTRIFNIQPLMLTQEQKTQVFNMHLLQNITASRNLLLTAQHTTNIPQNINTTEQQLATAVLIKHGMVQSVSILYHYNPDSHIHARRNLWV